MDEARATRRLPPPASVISESPRTSRVCPACSDAPATQRDITPQITGLDDAGRLETRELPSDRAVAAGIRHENIPADDAREHGHRRGSRQRQPAAFGRAPVPAPA